MTNAITRPRPNRIALCPAKLAFRRKGPVSAPAKTLLALPVRGGYDEPVEVRRDLDLTTEPRVGLNLIGKIQHIFFLVRRLAGATHPFFADIDVARRAGTAAAASAVISGIALRMAFSMTVAPSSASMVRASPKESI